MSKAYISGAICGHLWWPVDSVGMIPLRANLRGEFDRFSEPATFRDVLLHLLWENGGDFQNARFTADTEIVIEKKTPISPYKWQTRLKVREVSALAGMADLVNPEHYSGDFFN